MKIRCKESVYIKRIKLYNYELTFRSKYRAADIQKKKKSVVYGGLYIISKKDEKKLDIYEEYPVLYKKLFPKDFQKSRVHERNIQKFPKQKCPTFPWNKLKHWNVPKETFQEFKKAIRYFVLVLFYFRFWGTRRTNLFENFVQTYYGFTGSVILKKFCTLKSVLNF